MSLIWNFDNIPNSEKKKVKIATINANVNVLLKVAKDYNVIPRHICNACGTNINSIILKWFEWAKDEGKFDY